MSVELNAGLPSTRYIQTYIKEKTRVEVKLVTGDAITGTIHWQDPGCICIITADESSTLIWRQAIVYLQPK
ncbi:MAG: RNA-binding protein hfq [Cyanobacteria bacterium P01_A01_bin.37]